jgi:hypothetical protein
MVTVATVGIRCLKGCRLLALTAALAIGCTTSDAVNTGGMGGQSSDASAGSAGVGGMGGAGGAGATAGSGGADASAGAGGTQASAGSGGIEADVGTDSAAETDGISDASADTGNADANAEADGGGCVDLTVLNYLSWCSVSVEGLAPVSGPSQTVCVAPGAVSLSATALSGFKLGATPWHRTDGDQGAGEQGTLAGDASAATVTVNGPACVWVCCEFANGGGCPSDNQCP